MCSIEGTTNPNFDISEFAEINKSRGPDATEFYTDSSVRFAHNLLEISPNPKREKQPYITDKGNVLTYNGEIYGLGDDVWDVEWLATYLEKNGVEGLKENVNGMWAFAWYEKEKGKLTLCRDHFGVKPLYYTFFRDFLYFSSTMIPLAGKMFDEPTHYELFNFDVDFHKQIFRHCDGFNPGQRTPIKNLQKLYPGEILEINVENSKVIRSDNLWNSSFNLKPNYLWNKWELERTTTECITQVCRARNIKKTISLSGGLDSSLIASIARNEDNISASSVHWEDVNIDKKDPSRHMMDELQLSKETCRWLKLDHYVSEIPYDSNDYEDEVFNSMFGMPTWDIQRLLPRFFNITQAAKNNNRIYISGDCADEILTGYNGDFKIHEKGVDTIIDLFRKLGWSTDKDVDERDAGWREVGRMLRREMFKDDSINNRQFTKLLFHCDGFCTVLDHMCGYYGMESRVPFLHQKLVKYLMRIPGQQKLYIPFNNIPDGTLDEKENYIWTMMGHYKGLLRDCLSHHYVPNVRNRIRKTGFSNPWDARDPKRNMELREDQYQSQKQKLSQVAVDFKDNLVYNLIHDIKSEKVNE